MSNHKLLHCHCVADLRALAGLEAELARTLTFVGPQQQALVISAVHELLVKVIEHAGLAGDDRIDIRVARGAVIEIKITHGGKPVAIGASSPAPRPIDACALSVEQIADLIITRAVRVEQQARGGGAELTVTYARERKRVSSAAAMMRPLAAR